MWFKIMKFELAYRKKRPATYIYFGILFLVAMLAVSTDIVTIGGGTGQVKENAPATLAFMMVITSAVLMMITSAIMGVGVLRDFEHQTESMVFTTPISKFDYLFGRFLGSFIVTLFAFSGLLFGFIIGEIAPWRDADKLLPLNLWADIHPFLFFVIPNLFFSGVLFFVTGALARKMVVVYVQWIILFVVYMVSNTLTAEVSDQSLAALLDPFAINTVDFARQYWTVAEQNSMVIPIEGVVLWNRILWVGIGLVGLVIGYFSFSFNVVKNSFFKKKVQDNRDTSKTSMDVPKVGFNFGIGTYLLQVWTQSLFYFKYMLKGIPFITITVMGFFIVILNSFYIGEVFGTFTYPTTYLLVELITGAFTLFFVIILVFYSGELVWRERDVKISLIQDALPMPDFVNLVSKFLSLIMVYVVMLLGLIGCGVVIQAFRGYYNFEFNVYFGTLFTDTMSLLIVFTLLAFFIQVLVNNKFLGHALMIIFFIAMEVLENLGLEHGLFQFGRANLGRFSQMNGFGHFVTNFSWFDLYWIMLSVFLFAVAVMFAARGSEAAMKWRWKVGVLRLTKPLLTFGISAFLVFCMSGCYIYYNTNVVNTYTNSDEVNAFFAKYEKELKHYEFDKQPKVTDINLKVELYPETRDYSVEGYYVLKNFESEPITEIQIQLGQDRDMHHEYVTVGRKSTITENWDDYRFYIHELETPLQPGDTTTLKFKFDYITSGFKETENNTSIVGNGTFLNNSNFPSLGYSDGLELSTDDDRRDNDLEPKERQLPRSDERGLRTGFITDDSHGVDFEIVIGTVRDQIAIAPGYLQKEWEEDDRKYYHYKMDQPMMPFFNIVSARYEVVRDKTTIMDDSVEKEINLEIYYHKGHEYNLESMMKGMKKSFAYFSENFSPYQYRQMRILEFPRYSNFAQSFANTVPFSEGIGFMVEVTEEDDVDVPYFVTAHELAHQWWGHQLTPAEVQGGAVLSETLAQYSALMVMKQEYPQEHIKEFLREELDRYLRGRAREQKKEMPLELAENQSYIHYGKGANIMYALQDYIGEDSVNVALQRLVRDWGDFEKNGRYATTIELVDYLREVTPDSLQNVITDFFEKIVTYENKVDESTFTTAGDDYLVTLKLNTKKMESDSLGNSTTVAINDWIDVGVYTKDESGDDKLIYLKKHLFTGEESEIKIKVNEKPTSAGVDPLNKLIDRNPEDNTKSLSEAESA